MRASADPQAFSTLAIPTRAMRLRSAAMIITTSAEALNSSPSNSHLTPEKHCSAMMRTAKVLAVPSDAHGPEPTLTHP